MKVWQCLGIAILILNSGNLVSAHGTGATFEEEKDGYFVDIGYSEPAPVELQPLRFDFSTHVATTSEAASDDEVFTDVWVRIAQDRTLFFSGGINKPNFGPTGFTYIFPQAGEYQITARFQNDGETVVESTFPLIVAAETPSKKPLDPYATGGVGFLAGLLLMYFVSHKSKPV